MEFSSVKTYTGTLGNQGLIVLDTVPSSKVWKVEAIGLSNLLFRINGKTYTKARFGVYLNYPYAYSVNEALWLKAGDIVSLYNPNTSGINNLDYVISILEFNLSQ